jgi:hypothetical protein
MKEKSYRMGQYEIYWKATVESAGKPMEASQISRAESVSLKEMSSRFQIAVKSLQDCEIFSYEDRSHEGAQIECCKLS